MSDIKILDQNTINQIAAGEVIERPAAVVKELVENAIDAGSSAITIEIRDGGIPFIRITDNGRGIDKNDISLAFERHATSKIRRVEDLLSVRSLGFRGEALSSIAAVAQVECISKKTGQLTGCRYVIEGGEEKGLEEIGCPEGTTFVIHNLFYNTPARKKFLKTPMTEAGYINDLVERLAISHPDISFKFLNNNQLKLTTSGNGSIKDIIYHIYGRDLAAKVLEARQEKGQFTLYGFIGKPVVSRGNRTYMNYFVNGRYIKSPVIAKAIEDAYKPYSMQHRYPFTVLLLSIPGDYIDVNVHPTKTEVRFANGEQVYEFLLSGLERTLKGENFITEVSFPEPEANRLPEKKKQESIPEPFEKKRVEQLRRELPLETFYVKESPSGYAAADPVRTSSFSHASSGQEIVPKTVPAPIQETLFDSGLLPKEEKRTHRIIGQLFQTYWMVEAEDKLYMIDQHAAHEKVLFEKLMTLFHKKDFLSQMVDPPIILTLNMSEEALLKENLDILSQIGFEIEHFGGKEYSVRGVPADMLGLAQERLLIEFIDSFSIEGYKKNAEAILEKAASLSCKAAIKANHAMSFAEAETLIGQLLRLENPFHCPHGRPVIISMSKYEVEKLFKRVL